MTKILPLSELQAVRARLRAEGKRVVQCHGCFDIVHPGHVRYLRFASEQGDVLVVSVSSDAVVGKGLDRPYINEELRMENLAALEFVDYVVLDDHTWAGPILEAVKPDVYVKGKEYETNQDPRFLKERSLVEDYGGTVIFGSGDVVFSSSAIISRYRQKFDLDRDRIAFFCRRHGITRDAVDTALTSFLGKKVVVFADPLLDVYVHGEAAEVASEAPILSVTPTSETVYVGGGALIAGQLALLGADVTLVTVLSDDADAARFRSELARTRVSLEVVPSERRPTFVKTRYLVDGTKVFKVDRGRRSELTTHEAELVQARLADLLEGADALVVTDFGYGLVGQPLADAIHRITEATGTPWFADVSGGQRASILKFRGPSLAAPTEQELRFAFGDRESGVSHLALAYYRETAAKGLVITMGARGAVLFRPPEGDEARLGSDFLPAFDAVAVDNVGAGDVFLSGLIAGELGARRELGLYLGTALAAVHVGRLGNEPVPLLALTDLLDGRPELG
ncbi:MAG: adenylyltransferase/cytidyltransferase family protein [Alphaproteobacteria bacterium]|nr:adenylyltransferase/cytidyltransferase family protein [Alphaproteobacteria bacterium]